MKFETYIKTVQEIVKENYEFIIPVYQRPYVWDDEEIKNLLGDILNMFITNSNRQKGKRSLFYHDEFSRCFSYS